MKGVAVTGLGIVSSIGKDLNENYKSLSLEKHGISFPELLGTTHRNLPVGEIKLSKSELENILQLNEGHRYTRAAMLGIMAIKDLLNSSGYKEFPKDTAFISGTSVGGIDTTEKLYTDYPKNTQNRRFIEAQHPGFTTEQIAEYFNLKSFVTTISTACSSSANAIMLGARMIRSGKLKRVIVGGSDCLTKFTLNGFNSLKILSPDKCLPFDNSRNGLNLGEAAAYLILEADELCGSRHVYGRLTGYGNANDAYHQTASSENGDGAYLAMFKALEVANLNPANVDYINAHGTGTINNDLSESRALQRIFGKVMRSFSSTKAFTGHTLAAAGAVEAVFSLLALKHQEIFPNLNFKSEMEETGLRPVTRIKSEKINTILSNSFGFGGNCTSLIFQADE
ncbi:beta-ketoacyl-[acyl-carrier-protein] synthase family protein [Christiangramia salexigens]|uniref:Beta-ACP synthase n=1 Tax=Christiangramia salexigens TaxID=1913577 RepID=A0A1L3J307_9FLAO|nr:beta-ketoacyl-[acyl-carrier-protein] synthase family protein [Christiangramia salexigens]APG59508.1 beta-ACP synthase [Christiangramia salexigens]